MLINFIRSSIILLLTACASLAVQDATNTWDKPNFGIKFSLVGGPYAFFDERIVETTNRSAGVFFLREGKSKYGFVGISTKLPSDVKLNDYNPEADKVFVGSLKFLIQSPEIKVTSKKLIKTGETDATLFVFSFAPELPDFMPKKEGRGVLIVADQNGLRYRVAGFDALGNDPTRDKELKGLIDSLVISKTK